MKKSISLLLILAVVIGGFVFAGHLINGDKDENALKVAIVVSSNFGDRSFNDSARDGGEALKAEGITVNYVECGEKDFKQNMMNAAGASDMVVCVGWEFWEITDVATEYPDKKFIWIDNAVEEPEEYPNILNLVYSQNKGSYLAGYIAAAMSQSGTIGCVGGVDDDVVNDFIVGFTQGAEAANGSIQVISAFAGGDYDNPELGKELARELHAKNADIIFQIAGNTGNGVLQAAKEDGFYAIGNDKDQKIEFPEYEDAILCSVKKDVGRSIYDLVMMYANNDVFNGGMVRTADMSKGYVDIGYGNSSTTDLVSDDLKEEVYKLKQMINDGDIIVDSTID